MKEYETLRVYGRTLRYWAIDKETGEAFTAECDKKGNTIWEGEKRRNYKITQTEKSYIDYYADGSIAGTGTEDITTDRMKLMNLTWYSVHGWDGNRRNKGGNKWWDILSEIYIKKADRDKIMTVFTNRFPQYAELQTRKL